jgi:hypothetical protein
MAFNFANSKHPLRLFAAPFSFALLSQFIKLGTARADIQAIKEMTIRASISVNPLTLRTESYLPPLVAPLNF